MRMNKEKKAAVFYYFLMPLVVMYELPADCNFSDTVLTCQQSIPRELPAGIQNVYIADYPGERIQQGMFAHSSWISIRQLDINVNVEKDFSITDYAFVGLQNITTLGIHARSGNNIDEKAFVGIDRVKKLDLSNMITLKSNTLIKPLLYDNVLPNLRILILENVNTQEGDFNFIVSRSLLNMVRLKGITELSLRGTTIFWEQNANGISTGVEVLDVSNVSFSFVKYFQWDITLPQLKTLNFSSPVARYLPSVSFANGTTTVCNEETPVVLRRLETVYANYYFRYKEIYIKDVTWNISAPCLERIKVLHIRGSSLHFVNATINYPANCSLYELDMSLNKMKFLSANILKDLINLQHLYLGDNLLSSMSYHPDFKILFWPLHRLRRLSLAYNQITYIPECMFLYNLNLEWLDLQGNYLTSASFLHLQLSNLRFLNISDNRIAYLSGDDLRNFQTIITRIKNKIQEIKMSGNPFECSCESVNFIEWINEKPLNGYVQYSCYLGKQITTINDNSISKAKFLCIRALVYTISSVLSATVILTLLLIVFLTLRYFYKKRRAAKLETFLQNFHKGRLHQQFLCLLSYSDTDVDVSNKLYNKLESVLKDVIKCQKDIVCIDFKHFRAGVSIMEEVMRCMSESLVAVFVVSEAFCQSNWCRLEVKEAYEQQKPIILIFVEEVSEDRMTAYVRNIFQRYTRGKLVLTGDGEVDFQPGGIKGLCNSIILLAKGGKRDGRHLNDTQN